MNNENSILKDTERLYQKSLASINIYELDDDETFKDVTEVIMKHENTPVDLKKAIQEDHIRCFVFLYPSDGLKIKGYITLPDPTKMKKPIPLVLLLRGGNRLFCLPHPNEYSAQQNFAVISTTFRGGISEGEDEFGGNDVNDIKNLFDFLPDLEKKLRVHFHPTHQYMIGVSRGAMQMFLALGRYPEYQKKIKKVVSVTGMLNFIHAIDERPDVKQTMIKDFGLPEGTLAKEWIAYRQPVRYVSSIDKNMPILIIQGTKDIRISKQEGLDMYHELKKTGHNVSYDEIANAEHMLENMPSYAYEILKWLE
ncbi:MAG: alpha/beta hydrolase family protein [Candidatus Berkiella sp.]